MHSEIAKQINAVDMIKNTELEERRARIADNKNRIIEDGTTAEDFMLHPHWQKLQKDGEQLKQKLIKELRNGENTLRKINLIQKELDILEWFFNNPTGYIEKRNLELKRR